MNKLKRKSRLIQALTETLFSFLPKRFVKAVGQTAGGALLSQMIYVISIPLLSFYYSPFAFGIFGTYVACSNILSVFASARYEHAIQAPESDAESWGIFRLVVYLGLISMSIVAFVFLFWRPGNLQLFGQMALLIPAQAFVQNQYASICLLLNRNHAFSYLAVSRIVRNVVMAIMSILFSLLDLQTGLGLCLGYFSGWIVFVAMGYWKIFHSNFHSQKDYKISILKTAWKYRTNPMYLLPAHALNSFGTEAPILLLGYYFTNDPIAGYYFMINRILMMPVSTVTQSLGNVFYSFATKELHKKGECWRLFYNSTIYIFFIGLLFGLLLWIAFPFILSHFFKNDWEGAAIIVPIMIPMLISQLLYAPLSYIGCLPLCSWVTMLWNVARLALIVCLFYLLKPFGPYYSIIGISIATVIISLTGVWFTAKIARGTIPSVIRTG